MIQSRYLFSLIISTSIFLVLYFMISSLMKVEKILKPTASKVIKVAIITPVIPTPKPVIKATPQPIIPPVPIVKKVEKVEKKKTVPVLKPKPKKVVKKKTIKKVKPKKVVKKKVVKKKIIKKKIVKKKVIKKKIVKPAVIQEPIVEYIPPAPPVYVPSKPVAQPTAVPTNTVRNNKHKKAFLRNVRSKIIANKRYPKIAKRRHIEGSVKVRFDITKLGQVTNIRFINGKSIFHKSIRKTLARTFPMGIPAAVKGELPIKDISVVLHFNIR